MISFNHIPRSTRQHPINSCWVSVLCVQINVIIIMATTNLLFECNRFFVKCFTGIRPPDHCHRSLVGGYSSCSHYRGRKLRLGKGQGQTRGQTAVTSSKGNAMPDCTSWIVNSSWALLMKLFLRYLFSSISLCNVERRFLRKSHQNFILIIRKEKLLINNNNHTHFLCIRYSAKLFICINSFYLYNIPIRQILLLFLFHRWGNWSSGTSKEG